MPNLPSKDNAALLWLEGRISDWLADPAAIGLTPAGVALLAQRIIDARAARTHATAVHIEAAAATANFHDQAADMRHLAGAFISTIKGHAASSSSPPAVYLAAGVSPPAPPSPVPNPERPTSTAATLGGDGSITLHFKARGPTGTVWNVSRKLPHETHYSPVGHADVATKSFTDASIPGTVSSATYRVQGVRGSASGPVSFPVTVGFGRDVSEVGGEGAAVQQRKAG